MFKVIASFLATLMTLFPILALAVGPSILDTLPVTGDVEQGTASTFTTSYTVPASGQNKTFVLLLGLQNSYAGLSVSLNGVTVPMRIAIASSTKATHFTDYYIGVLAAPTTGTLSVHTTSNLLGQFFWFTVQDTAQSQVIDDFQEVGTGGGVTTVFANATTTVGNDLLLSYSFVQDATNVLTYGTSETQVATTLVSPLAVLNAVTGGSWKAAAAAAGTEIMTTNASKGAFMDMSIAAIKYLAPPSNAANNDASSWFLLF